MNIDEWIVYRGRILTSADLTRDAAADKTKAKYK